MDIKEKNVDDFFFFRLRKDSRKITRFLDTKLKNIGLKSTQINLLISLSSGNKCMSQVSKELGMDRTTLIRGLRPLERDGLIEKINTSDLRKSIYGLTGYGEVMSKKGSSLLEEAQCLFICGNDRYKALSEVL